MQKIKSKVLLAAVILAAVAFMAGCDWLPNSSQSGVDLGDAGNYVILAKSAVTNVSTSVITGDIGLSPASQSNMTGFSETLDASGTFATSDQVTGRIYAADMTAPTSSNLTTAISDMEAAYTAAAGKKRPDETELGAGEIGGLTLEPGLYKWGTGLSISTDVVLSGDGVWIFQIAEELTIANGISVVLSGGAQPDNIYWQVGSSATLGTTSHLEGTILAQAAITLQTGATVNGRALAQTQVSIEGVTITAP